MNYLFFQTIFTPGFFLLMAVIFLAAVLLFYAMYKKTKDLEEKEKDVFSDYDAILADARQKAAEIIAHATDEAAKLEYESKTIQIEAGKKEAASFEHIVKEHEEHLAKQAQDLAGMYDKALGSVKETYVQQVGQIAKTLEEKTKKNVEEMESFLDQTAGAGKESLHKKIEESFAKATIEISEYKRQEIEKTRQEIQAILLQVSQEVLGKVIPLTDHQDLVMQTLEKAEKEHMFDV